eukprot:2711744-Rhodomonas_salina.2
MVVLSNLLGKTFAATDARTEFTPPMRLSLFEASRGLSKRRLSAEGAVKAFTMSSSNAQPS